MVKPGDWVSPPPLASTNERMHDLELGLAVEFLTVQHARFSGGTWEAVYNIMAH